MKQYTVMYYENGMYEEPRAKLVTAKTIADAWEQFTSEYCVYAAWVDHFTTQKGDIHYFNNFAGKPY